MGKGIINNKWFFPLLAVLVLGGLFLLSNRKFPPLPADAAHTGLTDNSSCTVCHGEGGTSPLSAKHPPKEQCRTCHKRQ